MHPEHMHPEHPEQHPEHPEHPEDEHPEVFLQQQKERDEKKKRHTITACIVICALWIPIALFLYKPAFLFEKGVPQDAVSDR